VTEAAGHLIGSAYNRWKFNAGTGVATQFSVSDYRVCHYCSTTTGDLFIVTEHTAFNDDEICIQSTLGTAVPGCSLPSDIPCGTGKYVIYGTGWMDCVDASDPARPLAPSATDACQLVPVENSCNGQTDVWNGAADPDRKETNCAGCGTHDGAPVNMHFREMNVAPRVVAAIQSGISAAHDLTFAVAYDSNDAKRDFVDDALGSSLQSFARVVGVGFRHSFSDRLIVRGASTSAPDSLLWVSMTTSIGLYPDGAGGYVGEPGTDVRAVHSTGAWTMRTGGGDILVFLEGSGTGTKLHPWTTSNHHARLFALYPAAATGFRFVIHHEEDQGFSGIDALPAGACDGITSGSNVCDSTRGLSSESVRSG